MSNLKRIRGVSVFRPIIYGNTSVLLEPEERGAADHTHRWTVAVRSATSPAVLKRGAADQIGGADDLSYFIKKVTFKLHDTYPTPLRSIEKPPFEVTETGWGEFDIIIKIFFIPEAAEKPITFTHHLKLHPWPILDLSILPLSLSSNIASSSSNADAIKDLNGEEKPAGTGGGEAEESTTMSTDPASAPVLSPIHSWQYEEIVFGEPTETFYSILLSRPPTPLPKVNRHPRILNLALGGGGNFGEFTEGMEKEEGDKLDKAKMKVLEEIEKMRDRLITREKELSGMRKEVDELIHSAAATAGTA